MVKNSIRPIIIRIGTTNYTNNREIFRISTGYSVKDAEAADHERDGAGADAA